MKKKIKQKLHSRTGASVTFALLIFLVCTVIGSAVLTAGTAAAGRMSNVTEMDQRYYSVNSAARLLTELLEKDQIWVDGEKLYIGTETKREEVGEEDSSFVVKTAQAAEAIKEGTTSLTNNLSLTVTGMASDDLNERLALTVTEVIYPGGDLTLTLSNVDDTPYTVTLYFMNVGGAHSYKWTLYDIERANSSA